MRPASAGTDGDAEIIAPHKKTVDLAGNPAMIRHLLRRNMVIER
jgi:hypothetical protein